MEAEKFYVLAYEGDVTEKKYFEDLRQSSMFNDSGSIETIPLKKEHNGGNSPLDVKKLLSKAKAEYNFRATDEFWLIIDRDDWEKIHHVDFNALYDDCEKEKNFFIALSNPCFEFWLILHLRKLEDIADSDRERYWRMQKSVLSITTLTCISLIVLVMDEVIPRGPRHRFLCRRLKWQLKMQG